MRLSKAKAIIVAPNIEQADEEGSLDEQLAEILNTARGADIPVIFALSRKKLGQVCAYARLSSATRSIGRSSVVLKASIAGCVSDWLT